MNICIVLSNSSQNSAFTLDYGNMRRKSRVTRWVWVKVAQNVAQPTFCKNKHINFTVEISSTKILVYFCNYQKKTVQRRKFAKSGVNVMSTIFYDFRQFSAKKLAFF
jgi:hypothetical protein